MHESRRKTLLEFAMSCDLVICATALLLASGAVTRPFWQKGALLVQHPLRQLILLVALVSGWHLSLVLAGLYRSFRLSTPLELVTSLCEGLLLATICTSLWLVLHILASGGGLIWTTQMSLEVLLFAGTSYLLLLGSRLLSQMVARSIRVKGRDLRYVLVVGTNRRAIRAADMMISNSALGYRLVGFVDDCWHANSVPPVYQSMLIGKLADLAELLRTEVIDEVVVALPIASAYDKIRAILADCGRQGILLRCEVSLFDPITLQMKDRDAPLHFVTLHQKAADFWAAAAKRLIDVTLGSLVLCVVLPIFLCIALAIKLTTPGPVFFVQERLGLSKRKFKIYKFRTMVQNAEGLMAKVEHLNQTQGPTFKLSNDPRVTKVGGFLRKTSLDELPQLVNVLLGDMSLVGPRPLPLRDYNGFSEDWHRRRFSVKPGITCLWQVTGRSSIGFDRWMELDMNYIDNWSVWLDIKILFRTIPVVLRGSGAV